MKAIQESPGGRRVPPSGAAALELTQPASGEPSARVPMSTAGDVSAEGKAARWPTAAVTAAPAVLHGYDGGETRQFQHELGAGMLGVNEAVAAPVACFPFGGQTASLRGDLKAHGPTTIDFYTDR